MTDPRNDVRDIGPFRQVPYMGVIWVVHRARQRGFVNGDPDWCNLGQGQPEVGDLPGAPPRISSVELEPRDHAYGPLEGVDAARQAVADHYNRLFRQGKSQYGPENVAISMGGRLALTRLIVAMGRRRVGHQQPDYTAYEEMFNLAAGRVVPVSLWAREENGFALTPEEVAEAAERDKLGALLISNPCNPTGASIRGDDLRDLLEVGRATDTWMVLDEFYSHFAYDGDGPAAGPISAAEHVEDVERDPVVMVDGLTKSFRYPGWRVGWVVGPSEVVEAIARTSSSLDGGPSLWAQRAMLKALEPAVADAETRAVREAFSAKRNLAVERLSAMGVRFAREPDSTFYAWGCLDGLPAPFNDPMVFFERALERKVMTVPGRFFEVIPGREDGGGPSPFDSWMRFSFGPPMDNLEQGLDRLAAMLADA